MKNLYSKYFKKFYLQTGGFIPYVPLNHPIYPGDFFQIIGSEIIVLGNIYLNQLIGAENCVIGEGRPLNEESWNFSSGVKKPYSGRGAGENPLSGQFEFSRQLLKFNKKGSFLFHSQLPESVSISNWNSIKNELIIKLTQTQFSFREVFIVTESATTASWTLAVAGDEKAELEIASDHEGAGIINLFGHESSKSIQSKDLEYYQRNQGRYPNFFKAKKLVVQEDSLNIFIGDLINSRESVYNWASNFYDYNFEYGPAANTPRVSMNAKASFLDMLSAGDLNPNSALQYFSWAEASLNDVMKLFPANG